MSTENGESSPKGRGSPEAKAWAAERAEAFGQAVKFWRNQLDLTAVDLANRTKEVGYPITRATIAKIETNSRNSKIDLCEVIALAVALRVSPLDLVFPGFPQKRHRSTPRTPMRAEKAIEWFSSDRGYARDPEFFWGGPHTPSIEKSIEGRDEVERYYDLLESIGGVEEIGNLGALQPKGTKIFVEGASNYKWRVELLRDRLKDRYNMTVNLPWWHDRIEEPPGNDVDGEG